MRGSLRRLAQYNTLLVEKKGNYAVVTLNRPKALNALNAELMSELNAAIETLDKDASVGCIVLTGSDKAFVAGADIKEMNQLSFAQATKMGMFDNADRIASKNKPIIAAVKGYALGGGCELALLCDIVVAGESAQFGQPEIKLGTIPGIGGTQRLTRVVGKAKAMDMCLTGDMIKAQEAKELGLVSRVVPDEQLLTVVGEMATKIASYSQPVVQLCKEAVNAAFESSLAEGVRLERKLFYSTFALEDRKIGMQAFVDKAKPVWKNQ